MFEKLKSKLVNVPKDAIKEELKTHSSTIAAGVVAVALLYLIVKVNTKPVNVVINVNGGAYPW